MNTILEEFLSLLTTRNTIKLDGDIKSFDILISNEEIKQRKTQNLAKYITCLTIGEFSFSVIDLTENLRKVSGNVYTIGHEPNVVNIEFDQVFLSQQVRGTQIGSELLSAFDYIEKVRAYGVNIDGRARLPKEKNADLYFAGKSIVNIIRQHGNSEDISRLERIIGQFEKSFKPE